MPRKRAISPRQRWASAGSGRRATALGSTPSRLQHGDANQPPLAFAIEPGDPLLERSPGVGQIGDDQLIGAAL
jgi:hypothetical protein